MRIMDDISYLGPHTDDANVLTLDDPELFQVSDRVHHRGGLVTLSDREATALRTYIQKGGFVIVDDFKMLGWRGLDSGGWDPFEANMKRVLPGVRFFEMEDSHPIFHAFFEIDYRILNDFPQAYNSGRPVFRGVYEDNDPRKRLVMIVNYNTDISQYWSGRAGAAAGGRHERGVQARRELSDVRDDALRRGHVDGAWRTSRTRTASSFPGGSAGSNSTIAPSDRS